MPILTLIAARRSAFYIMLVKWCKLSAGMNNWRFKLWYDGECPLCRREALVAKPEPSWFAGVQGHWLARL